MGAKVAVEGLTKRFGRVTAVADVSFAVEDREFFSLLGPSGCGKTTTLRCVAGLESADGGRVTIGTRTVFDAGAGVHLAPERRGIGMVFQNYAVWPHMSVYENIAYPLKVAGLHPAQRRERVGRVVEMLSLQGLEHRMPSQLSGGQQQRVALGRALAMNPEVLLLDEPLSNLDAKLRENMRVELLRLQKETGIPILYVTHDQLEALALSDRIAVMSEGRIHQCDTPERIYSEPATPFVLDFIGTMVYLPCEPGDEGRGGEVGEVRLPTGDRVAVRRLYGNGPHWRLGIRPEDLRVYPADEPPPKGEGGAGRAGSVPGRISLRVFLGSFVEYQVEVAGHLVRVQADPSTRFVPGQRVRVAIRQAVAVRGGSGEDRGFPGPLERQAVP